MAFANSSISDIIATNIQSIVRAAIILNMPKDFGKTGKNFDKLIDLRAKKASVLPKVTVYTFGTPRIGNSVFSNLVEVTVGLDDYYRVEIDGIIYFLINSCLFFVPINVLLILLILLKII